MRVLACRALDNFGNVLGRIEFHGPNAMNSCQSLIAQAVTGMRAFAPLLVLAIMEGLWLASPAYSATITVNAPDAYGRTFVDVVGEITANDDAALKRSGYSPCTGR